MSHWMHFHSRDCLLPSRGTWGVLSQNKSFNQGCWNRQRFLVHSGKPVGDILLNVREGSLKAVRLWKDLPGLTTQQRTHCEDHGWM